MKRILAMLLAVIFSVENNVGIQFSGNDDFLADSYYTVPEVQAPDYRQLYTQGVQMTSADNCTKNTRMGKNLALIRSDATPGLSAYWIAENSSMTLQDIPDGSIFTFTEYGDIIVPINCIIETSSTSGGGHYMRLDSVDGKYIFVVENMERWYCCRYRKESGVDENGNENVWVHSEEIGGITLSAGQLLGTAKNDTTISIFDAKNKSLISIHDFYNR